jgi:hypothetical protein
VYIAEEALQHATGETLPSGRRGRPVPVLPGSVTGSRSLVQRLCEL